MLLNVETRHKRVLRATTPEKERKEWESGGGGHVQGQPIASAHIHIQRGVRVFQATHRIVANWTAVFEIESARIQPGAGPAST
jgi:hypothetical protein